jgi:cation diffusion facilitator family transporter
MIAEAVGGILANSLAVATDAAHLLTDFASFMISLFSIWLASRPATQKYSFGWYRAEVIGALTSVLMIWVVTGILVYMAIERLSTGVFDLDARIMLITAGIGVLVNIVMGISLQVGGVPHGHSHGGGGGHGHAHGGSEESGHGHGHAHGAKAKDNINVRAAFIHVIGDFFQSLGVFIAALVIFFRPDWAFIDPICTFLFSILVLVTTFNIIKDVLNVFMEGIPKGIDFLEVQKTLLEIPGVLKVHNLRVWSLSLDKVALSTHLAVEKGRDPAVILKTASHSIRSKFDIFELTIQVEEYRDEMADCRQCEIPSE